MTDSQNWLKALVEAPSRPTISTHSWALTELEGPNTMTRTHSIQTDRGHQEQGQMAEVVGLRAPAVEASV